MKSVLGGECVLVGAKAALPLVAQVLGAVALLLLLARVLGRVAPQPCGRLLHTCLGQREFCQQTDELEAAVIPGVPSD
jgi:hypothetical protein